MAVRYLISGGNGNSNSTTNWSTTSGGTSGASVPTTVDSIVIDAASLNAPLIFNANIQVQSITVSGYTGTITVDNAITVIILGTATNTGFLLFSSLFTFTSVGTGLLRLLSNNASVQCSLNTGNVILDCNVLFNQAVSQVSNYVLQSNITFGKKLSFNYTSAHMSITGAYSMICLGDFEFNIVNNITFNVLQPLLVMAGTTPQIFSGSPSPTSLHQFNVRTIFNSTSDITISGIFRHAAVIGTDIWFTWISGNVTCDSTQELRFNDVSLNMDTGPIVWNKLNFVKFALARTLTLYSDFHVKNIEGSLPANSNPIVPSVTIESNNLSTRKFVLMPEGTQTLLVSIRCTPQIDSNDGQTIFSVNGTEAPLQNWRLLVAPKTYASVFIG